MKINVSVRGSLRIWMNSFFIKARSLLIPCLQ
jgi:hypothetical protein